MTAHVNPAGFVQTGIADAPFRVASEPSMPQANETMLRLVGVAKRFGSLLAVNDVSFEVKRGEILSVIGRSGAGKSTLIRCLNGLEKPDNGRIEILGRDIVPLNERELRKVRRKIGMIFQHFNLLSSKTVADNVALPLKIAGRARNERGARVAALLQLVGLEDKASVYPAQLSGGQKQRVGIARALAANPDLLLSDEATSALDPETTTSILALLRDINRKFGLTVVLITHEMNVVRAIAGRVIVLDRGRIVEEGYASDVLSNPRNTLTRRLLAPAHLSATESSVDAANWLAGLAVDWAPGLDTILRITMEGELASRPVLADLHSATGARPVILRAYTTRRPESVASTILFSVPGGPALAARIERYLTRVGVTLEILGHAQSAS